MVNAGIGPTKSYFYLASEVGVAENIGFTKKGYEKLFAKNKRSKLDYDCFGDVVCFDTTFRINKYNLICAPFVGVNHHWKNVLFGCAFLLDETTESFIWLFESFKESEGNGQPKNPFADEEKAMSKAIELKKVNKECTNSNGISCRCALKMFDLNNLTCIPTQLIIKRWTKEAQKGIAARNDKSDLSIMANDEKFSKSLHLSEFDARRK
ncbi:protein FAR1-RELATED SEQUENCE 3-like [Olea europaea var. sylvestris]|uniref:protein FAR1-RELATED SEQUENCE 3-like n=1 Tax=Olea europaea var. sylvestris TaxID=158386 RepID=UPI000C1D2A3B|nr:protein FAR1-RELATED SEQUENCE 3-like [Olea europaea var. sylvestris]